jgi:energy-coupling factor transporter transmembrane protein EcfT
MAELTLFGYRHRNTGLQVLDARVKLGAMAAISIVTLQTGPYGLGIATLLALMVLWKSAIAPGRLIAELRFFMLFLICIWATRALLTPGEAYAQWAFLKISRPGFFSGALLSWRLLLIAILGLGLTATTPSARIRAAVEWFLRPIPGIPHQTIATMIGLLVRFIPLILSQSREIRDAQRARGVDNRKNPIYRLARFGMPLLRRSVVTADYLASAMEARNYSSQRTAPCWQATAGDYCALLGVAGTCLLMILV